LIASNIQKALTKMIEAGEKLLTWRKQFGKIIRFSKLKKQISQKWLKGSPFSKNKWN
jgi:hypothetical protein